MTREREWIGTRSARKFWPLTPDPDTMTLVDIAYGLAHRARFAGQTIDFYSVAQHSLLVADHLPDEHKPWGLLHDAAEAYLPDVWRPIKDRFWVEIGDGDERRIVPFRQLEREILACVAQRFGLAWPISDEVRRADDSALATERRDLFDDFQPEWSLDFVPFNEQVKARRIDVVRREFLQRLETVMGVW